MSLLERKNPFGPEDKTAPSVRNPILEEQVGRAAIAVVEVPPTAPTPQTSQLRPTYGADGLAGRRTDDASGPTTPRPRLALAMIARVVADDAFIRVLPLDPRDAFCLAHLDGQIDLHTVVDITGMAEEEVMPIIEKLIDLGVVEVK